MTNDEEKRRMLLIGNLKGSSTRLNVGSRVLAADL